MHRSRIGFTVSSNGAVSVINSDYYPNIDIDLIPGITADRALEIAQTDFLALSSADTVRIKKDPELIVLPVEGDNSYSYVLAYNLALAFKGLQAVFNETYFVDATTGDVIERYSNLKSGTLNGTISYNYWPEHDYDTQQSSPYKTGTVDLTLLTGWVARTTTSSSAGYYNFANISIQPYYIYPRFNNSYVKIINEGPTASNQRTPTSSYS